MKKFAVIVWAILTFVPSVAQAQIRDDFQATAPKTKLETALRNRDGFMVKDLYRLGTVAGNGLWKQQVIVDALVFHAPGPDSKSIKGIRILLIDNTSPGLAAYLDIDEIEDLCAAIKRLVALSDKQPEITANCSEFESVTKDGFRVGVYMAKDKTTAYLTAGPMDVSRFDSDLAFYNTGKNVYLPSVGDLKSVESFLEDGLALLNGK